MDIPKIIHKTIGIIDITFLTIIFVTISITFSIMFNRYMGPFDPEKAEKKSTLRIILEIYQHLAVIAIAAYIIRMIVEQIPFPLDDIYNFNHNNVHEIGGGVIFGFSLFFYQIHLNKKIEYLFNDRIFGEDCKQ